MLFCVIICLISLNSFIRYEISDKRDRQNTYMGGLISLKEASRISGYHQDYLSYLIRSNKLPGEKIGRNWCVLEADLKIFLAKKNGANDLVTDFIQHKKIFINKPIFFIIIGFLIILFLVFYLYVTNSFKYNQYNQEFSTSKKDLNFGDFSVNTIYSENAREINSSVKITSTP